jgi:hypothetical protein
LQQAITLKVRFAATVGRTHPRLRQRHLLAGDRDVPRLMAEPRLLAVRLTLMPLSATLRDFVLQQALSNAQPDLDGK